MDHPSTWTYPHHNITKSSQIWKKIAKYGNTNLEIYFFEVKWCYQIPVSFLGVKLDSKSARVSGRIGRTSLTAHSAKSGRNWSLLANRWKQAGLKYQSLLQLHQNKTTTVTIWIPDVCIVARYSYSLYKVNRYIFFCLPPGFDPRTSWAASQSADRYAMPLP